MDGAGPDSRPTLGVTLDPSEDHMPRTVVEGEECTRSDGTFVAGGNGGGDGQHV